MTIITKILNKPHRKHVIRLAALATDAYKLIHARRRHQSGNIITSQLHFIHNDNINF